MSWGAIVFNDHALNTGGNRIRNDMIADAWALALSLFVPPVKLPLPAAMAAARMAMMNRIGPMAMPLLLGNILNGGGGNAQAFFYKVI